jgi:ABC-2 type transport system permease protein
MNKTWLILQREYITRVKNKTFLLSTFLLPIAMLLFIFGSAYFAASSKDSMKKIAVINDPGYFKQNLQTDSNRLNFVFVDAVDSNNFTAKGYDGVLDLKHDSASKKFTIHSVKQLSMDTKKRCGRRVG